jgi:hypothetical protein
MGARALRALALVAVALTALAAPAVAAAPHVPTSGTFVPGESLGGVRLGMTKAEVVALWGAKHGVCRGCERTTWYFNLKPFEPQGAGVELRNGRVSRVFTLWRPLGWRTDGGLELGVQTDRLLAAHPELTNRGCAGYQAYVEPGRATSAYYVFRGRLWGFGLTRAGSSPCL